MTILDTAIIDATVEDGRLQGRLGGSLSEAEFQGKVVPLAWAVLAGKVAEDCTADGCTPGSDGAVVVDLFDTTPQDYQVTLDEFRNSNLMRSLLAPDLDIYDDQGRHNPGCDRVPDSLSFGVQFTAVPASF